MSSLPEFKIIAAIDAANGLGFDGGIPWHYREDFRHFATTTRNTTVVMGRLTYESIPNGLSGRRTVVVSRTQGRDLETCLLSIPKSETIFVVGGAQIYKLALEMESCRELILTRIHKVHQCDVFFPPFEDNYSIGKSTCMGEFTIEHWSRL